MAVIYQQGGGGGLLGGLGALASIGGVLTGQPWLSALGTGLNAANGMMNGNAQSAGDLAGAIGGLINSWKNPVSGNIAKTPYQATDDDWARMYKSSQQQPMYDWRAIRGY